GSRQSRASNPRVHEPVAGERGQGKQGEVHVARRGGSVAEGPVGVADLDLPAQAAPVPLVLADPSVEPVDLAACQVPLWKGQAPRVLRRLAVHEAPLVLAELLATIVPEEPVKDPTRQVRVRIVAGQLAG